MRVRPGALLRLCREGEPVREGFGRRLYETPGVIATGEQELGTSLQITRWDTQAPMNVLEMVEEMREKWATPGGEEFTEAVDLWRHAREVALGFYYQWDPPPPKPWSDARRAWKAYVGEILERSRKIDSELQVWNLCAANENLRLDHPWHAWRRLKDTFKPNIKPVWADDFALAAAKKWLQENEGICWVEHIAFGEALSIVSKVPYYGSGAKASREILDAEGPIIASMRAHSEGKNLQRYSKNLIVSPPTSGKLWEQVLGRTHRPGQQADEVTVEVALFTPEHYAAFSKAREEAEYIENMFGSRQKLMYADVSIGRTTEGKQKQKGE
jgi:hypothetical protein